MTGCPQCDRTHPRGSSDCPASRIGDTVAGRYKLEALLGAGGFGAVYRASHVDLGSPFAVKISHRRAAQRPDLVARFLREARTAASLQHPGIVRITDFGKLPDESPYLVMEFVTGETLGVAVHAQPSTGFVVQATSLVLDALKSAHEAGVVHRDLKPDNVLCSRDRDGVFHVKIVDFGLAKIASAEKSDDLTTTGHFIGTIRYASPEQLANSKSVGAHSDVYSVGAMTFFLLTGRYSHGEGSDTEIMARIVKGEIERHPARINADTPAWLDAIVARSLALDPAERFHDAGAMLSAIRAAEAPSTIDLGRTPAMSAPHRRGILWTSGAAALLLAGACAAWYYRQAPSNVPPAETAPKPVRAGMIPIHAGTFSMGSSRAEIERAFAWCRELTPKGCDLSLYERELPEHAVSLSGFSIDAREVTTKDFAQWLNEQGERVRVVDGRIVESAGRPLLDLYEGRSGLVLAGARFEPKADGESLPVVQVTWFGAQQYCEAHNKRLPTEAEWELAARGAGRRTFPWGEKPPTCASVAFGRGPGLPCVGSVSPSAVATSPGDVTPEGVHDLGGSVSEWVADDYASSYESCNGPCLDPVSAGRGGEKVCRGGNWGQLAEMTRGAGRGRLAPEKTSHQIGFRCAAGEPPQAVATASR